MNTAETKLFGLSRPLASALISAGLFLLITLLPKLIFADSLIVYFILFDLELLGRLTVSALGAFANIRLPEIGASIVTTLISIIPPTIISWLIGFERKSAKTAGIVLLTIYLCLIAAVSSVLILMAI